MWEGWRGKDGHTERIERLKGQERNVMERERWPHREDGKVEGSGEKCGRDGEGKMATQRG